MRVCGESRSLLLQNRLKSGARTSSLSPTEGITEGAKNANLGASWEPRGTLKKRSFDTYYGELQAPRQHGR